jgi:uncharacterized protein (TIGR03546 family)
MLGIQAGKLAVRSLLRAESPQQWGAGFALGMWFGLVPKDNLTSAVLMTLMCLLRVNLPAGTLAALLFSLLSPIGDPLFHQVGNTLLAHDSLHASWVWMFDQPIIPWTSLNNTVVLGSFLTGLVMLWPVGSLATRGVERFGPKLAERLQRYRLGKLLLAADVGTRVRSIRES